MKHEDLTKKLENLKTPDIELTGHRRALKMALLSSGRFKKRTIMDWAKMLAPVATAVLLVAVMGVFAVDMPGHPYLGGSEISRFTSYEQLQNFIKANAQQKTSSWRNAFFDLAITGSVLAPESGEGSSLAPADSGYSTTNIQVAGVDEADIVKTDGEYVYLVSGNRTIIVEAYPPEQAQVLSEIELEGTAIGIFINGDRLVVFEQDTLYYIGDRQVVFKDVGEPALRESDIMPYVSPKVLIKVYDISDRENPQLQRELSADGQYVSSRMIGDYAYVVINEPVYEEDDGVNLPRIYSEGTEKEIPATDIYYCDVPDYSYMYTSIIAINTQNDGQEPAYETILLGASSTLYVSPDNIYLTFPVWDTGTWESQKTSIHRIHIEGAEIEYVASGEVPGMVLNQFSMDEYDDYFRVATTTRDETSRNNVYVLNMALNITGSLTDLAPGETIYSARFMGDRGYLVTFKQVDPLFVIDLKDPYDPEVLGYLKVTGYSDYLHPYDENHIIGIGKETTDAGEFAWYQGVKISLFDVTDVSNPREISKVEIGHRGTDSPVLWDHKAFLFDRSRNLLVMPILEAKVDVTKYSEEELVWAYGEPVWQGAYVFHISPDVGLNLTGRITHIESPADLTEGYYYYYSPLSVKRSLYIDDVLYTISDAKVKMNVLENLDYIGEVALPYSTWTPYDYPPVEPGVVEWSSGVESADEMLPE
jgi:inhibitor of cysteine peptidase